MKLRLCAPLIYLKIDNKNDDICKILSKYEEYLLCFELNPLQSRNIEPDQRQFLGSQVFTGRKIEGENLVQDENFISYETNKNFDNSEIAVLPQGLYLLVQRRSVQTLGRAEWLDMAIEQQKDGLWERNKLGNLLYVRYLYEDRAFVTQVFRPVEI